MSPPAERETSADLLRSWGAGARSTARRRAHDGDTYGAELADARATVYVQAAALLDQHDPDTAVTIMLDHARELRVLTPPVAGFDAAGLDYLRARAWQHCAHYLNPDAPTVQPAWD